MANKLAGKSRRKKKKQPSMTRSEQKANLSQITDAACAAKGYVEHNKTTQPAPLSPRPLHPDLPSGPAATLAYGCNVTRNHAMSSRQEHLLKPPENRAPVPNLYWRSLTQTQLRKLPRFVGLPEADQLRLAGPASYRFVRQDSAVWQAVHQGALTTGLLKDALGLREDKAARVLRACNQASHSHLIHAYKHLQAPAIYNTWHLHGISAEAAASQLNHQALLEALRLSKVSTVPAAVGNPTVAGNEEGWEQYWQCAHAARDGLSGVRCAWGLCQEAGALASLLQLLPASTMHEVGMFCLSSEHLPPSWCVEYASLPPLGASPDALVCHHVHVSQQEWLQWQHAQSLCNLAQHTVTSTAPPTCTSADLQPPSASINNLLPRTANEIGGEALSSSANTCIQTELDTANRRQLMDMLQLWLGRVAIKGTDALEDASDLSSAVCPEQNPDGELKPLAVGFSKVSGACKETPGTTHGPTTSAQLPKSSDTDLHSDWTQATPVQDELNQQLLHLLATLTTCTEHRSAWLSAVLCCPLPVIELPPASPTADSVDDPGFFTQLPFENCRTAGSSGSSCVGIGVHTSPPPHNLPEYQNNHSTAHLVHRGHKHRSAGMAPTPVTGTAEEAAGYDNNPSPGPDSSQDTVHYEHQPYCLQIPEGAACKGDILEGLTPPSQPLGLGQGRQTGHICVIREIVEVKCSCPFDIEQRRHGSRGKLKTGWVVRDRGPREEVLPLWIPQLQLHMLAAGTLSGLLVNHSASRGMRVYRVYRDDEYLRMMMRVLGRFYTHYVLHQQQPPRDMFFQDVDYKAFLHRTVRLASGAQLVVATPSLPLTLGMDDRAFV